MLSIAEQKVDLLGLVVLAVVLAAAVAISVIFPALMPYSFVALVGVAVLVYWSIRWEIQMWAWLWVLSFGIVDRGLWRLELTGFFNLTIPRLIFIALISAYFIYFLMGRGRLRFDRALFWVMT